MKHFNNMDTEEDLKLLQSLSNGQLFCCTIFDLYKQASFKAFKIKPQVSVPGWFRVGVFKFKKLVQVEDSKPYLN